MKEELLINRIRESLNNFEQKTQFSDVLKKIVIENSLLYPTLFRFINNCIINSLFQTQNYFFKRPTDVSEHWNHEGTLEVEK